MRQGSLFDPVPEAAAARRRGREDADADAVPVWWNRYPHWPADLDGDAACAVVLDVAHTGRAYGLAEALNVTKRERVVEGGE